MALPGYLGRPSRQQVIVAQQGSGARLAPAEQLEHLCGCHGAAQGKHLEGGEGGRESMCRGDWGKQLGHIEDLGGRHGATQGQHLEEWGGWAVISPPWGRHEPQSRFTVSQK